MVLFPTPDNVIPRVSPDHRLVWEETEAQLLDTDDGRILRLNPTGALLWELFDGSSTFGDVAGALASRYHAEDALRHDIQTLLCHLYALDLVTFTVDPAGFEARTFHINRSQVLLDLLRDAGWRAAAADQPAELSMWWPIRSGPRTGHRQLFEPWQTRELDSKNGLYRLLRQHHLSHFAPDTWDSLKSFLGEAAPRRDDVFYVKKAISGQQQGIQRCIGPDAVANAVSRFRPHACVIQREVPDPMLIEGRKYNVRSFLLVTADGRGYLHRRASVDLLPAAYDSASDDPTGHFSLRGSTWRISDRVSIYPDLFQAIHHIMERCTPLFARLGDYGDDGSRYALFGLDFLFDRKGRAHLLEFNHTPHLGYSTFTEDTAWLKTALLTDMTSLLLGGDKPTGFVELGGNESHRHRT